MVVDAITDLMMRTMARVALQLAEADEGDDARTRLLTSYRLIQRGLDILGAEGDDDQN